MGFASAQSILRAPIFVFLEIELPSPKPEQHQEDPQRVNLPVRLRPVGAFEPEAHHSREHDKDADNLLYFHAPSIAQISASDVRLEDARRARVRGRSVCCDPSSGAEPVIGRAFAQPFADTRAINSSTRDKNSFRVGDAFAL
jgi:hypothetical protein